MNCNICGERANEEWPICPTCGFNPKLAEPAAARQRERLSRELEAKRASGAEAPSAVATVGTVVGAGCLGVSVVAAVLFFVAGIFLLVLLLWFVVACGQGCEEGMKAAVLFAS